MRIGYAMYSARDLTTNPQKMRSTLEALAHMGYDGVEFFVYAGTKPEELKAMLKDYGLEAISTHVHKPRWDSNALGEIEYAVKAGIPRLVYPWVDPKDRTKEFYKELPNHLKALAEQSAKKGIQLLYHNHDFEFETLESNTVMEYLLSADDSYELELDTFWAEFAGVNVEDYLKKLGCRVPVIHIKDCLDTACHPPRFTPIGLGRLTNNESYMKLAKAMGKEWIIVELDNSPYDPLESARISIENIKKIL